MYRRRLLAAIASASAVGPSGCLDRLAGGTALANVEVINMSDVPWSIVFEVRDGETTVATVTPRIPPDQARSLACTWPADPGEYLLTAGVPAMDSYRTRYLGDVEYDSVTAYVVVGIRGSIRIRIEERDASSASAAERCE